MSWRYLLIKRCNDVVVVGFFVVVTLTRLSMGRDAASDY